jgi:flavin reductase (DIM6/NTAB) family NADH-FMN oxidoreductase RutF
VATPLTKRIWMVLSSKLIQNSHISGEHLRHAMSYFATGVAVVTSRGASGQPVGTTANAVTSLSLDPALILVCFAHASQTLAALRDHGAFAVNVLGAHHRDVSSAFARRGSDGAWDGIDYHAGHTASPRLSDALATLDCAVEETFPGGDHQIVVGRVLEIDVSERDREPLLYYRGDYASLGAA